MKKLPLLAVACAVIAACAAVTAGAYFVTVRNIQSSSAEPAASADSAVRALENRDSDTGMKAADIEQYSEQPEVSEEFSAGIEAWSAQKYDTAYEIFKKSAEEGSPQAMTALGYLYLSGSGTEMDVKSGLRLYRMAAAAGEPYAMYGLAEYLKNNPSYENEPGEAREYLKTAALDKKLPAACRDYYEMLLGEGSTEEAKAFLKKNSDEGQNWAMTTYGISLCDGTGPDLDVEAGLKLLRKSAQNGDVTASYCAGCIELRCGKTGTAEQFFTAAAKEKYPPALIALGRLCLRRGEVKKGVEYLQSAGSSGSAEAYMLLGKLSEAGRFVSKDPAAAAKYYKMAADKNDAEGYNELARLTENGEGVKKSPEEAYRLYSEGAAAGSPEALYNQGRMEIYGTGTEKNVSAGVEKVKESAQRGESEAKMLLAAMYDDGKFFKKDTEEADRLYREAAAQGNPKAQYLLGEMLRRSGTVDNLTEAMKFYRLAADQGSAEAQYALGQCYADGSWHEPDMASAVKWYTLAAGQGFPPAMCAVGLIQLDVAENDAKVKEAAGMIQKAAEKGFVPAEYTLGQIYEQGRLGKKDIAKAVDHYLKGARGGDPESQVRLAGILSRGEFETPVDLNESFRWYLAAARQGNVPAQCNTAAMYAAGQGTVKNLEQAAAWYKSAAERGSSLAQYNYALMCLRGIGIPRNEEEGLTWLKKAGDSGSPQAQNELGIIYSQGRLVEQDYKVARRWFQLAADSGSATAQYNLGLLYSTGVEGGPSDAVSCFEQAAAQGHVLAAWYLGRAYEEGTGVTADPDKAREYYQSAVDAGCERARESLAQLDAKRKNAGPEGADGTAGEAASKDAGAGTADKS